MQNNTKKTGIVPLWDLPENTVYLDLKEDYKKELLETAKNLAGNKWNDLARKIEIPIPKDKGSTLIRNFRRGKLASLIFIKKLSKFLIENNENRFSLKNIQKNISHLSVKSSNNRILNPKFPINFNSKEGAIIISCIYHDGGINVRDLEPFYANTSKKLRKRFLKSINSLIGKMNVISKKKYNSHEVCCPKILGIILTTIGLIPGKKSINNPSFPKFVFNYSKELKYEFLSQSIADDGWIYCPKEKYGYINLNFTIDLTKHDEKFRNKVKKEKLANYLPGNIIGNKNLFESLGHKVQGPYFKTEWHYKNNRYTQEWQINIRDLKSLKILSKNLNIPLKYKQKKLNIISKRERIRTSRSIK